MGVEGSQGPKGDTGPAGAKGDAGPAGPKGDTGLAGAKGDQGAKGDTGAQGPAGSQGPGGSQGPAGPAGPAGFPTVTTVQAVTAWNSQTDGTFHPVPSLTMSLQMANAGPAIITWSVAVPMNGAIVTRLVIDGVVMPNTNVVVGNTTYAASTGTYYTALSAGTHQVVLQYRTTLAFTFDPRADWQSARLQALAFDQ